MTTPENNTLRYNLDALLQTGLLVAVSCLLALIAGLSIDHYSRTEPTIPDPGQLPVADASIRFEPTRVIPQTITLRVRSGDQERFASTLRKDILAHGGWADGVSGPFRGRRFSAITMESYLERLQPLMAAADPDEPHPNYQSWARDTASQPGALAPAPFVQISFQIDRLATQKRLVKGAGIIAIVALGLAIVAAAARRVIGKRG